MSAFDSEEVFRLMPRHTDGPPEEYTDEEYRTALQAPLEAVCETCPHTKAQHYAAGPRCMLCDCRLFLAPPAVCASGRLEAEVKAEALLEHRRRVARFMPAGLVNRATVLADLDDYAARLLDEVGAAPGVAS